MEENLPVLLCFTLYLRASPHLAYIWRGDLTEGFLRYKFEGLIQGGDDFRNFTVYCATLSETSAKRSTSTMGIVINAKVSVKDCVRNLVTTAYNTKVEKQMRKGV